MSNKNTPEFRVAFPAVFQPKLNKLSGKEEFSVVALFPLESELTGDKKVAYLAGMKKLKVMASEAAVKKFGPDKTKWPPKMRNPFRDQADREKMVDGKLQMPQGYVKGALYLNLKSTQRPGVVNQQVEDIIDASEFYGGCWAMASVSCYGYDTAGNRGVGFGLGNLQKTRDDKAFGNRTKPQDDFSPVAEPETGNEESSADLFL